MFLLITSPGEIVTAYRSRKNAISAARAWVGTEDVMGYGQFHEENSDMYSCHRSTGFGQRYATVRHLTVAD